MSGLRAIARRARESLFLIPVLIIGISGGIAGLALYVDSRSQEALESIPLILSSTVSGGRSIATTVAGATITVAAIVFSITALSSQIAANQYSPRAVAGFFEDPFQQMVIGLIVGTFTYSLVVLAGLSSTLASNSEPSVTLAVSLNVYLGVASAIGIVAYIDHSLRRFQVDSVVRRIAQATHRAVRRQDRNPRSGEGGTAASLPSGEPVSIVAKRTGWVQRIDTGAMINALPPGSSGRIGVRMGEAVAAGDQIITLWGIEGDPGQLADRLRSVIHIGRDRSVDSDPSFGIRQLVDIALKALSPGVNDPTTAVDVVHQLKIPIREILLADAPTRVFGGPDGRKVYLAESPSRSDFVHAAFAEIRLAAAGQVSVLRALLEVLGDLQAALESSQSVARGAAVEEEIAATIEMVGESRFPEADERRALGRNDAEGG